MDPSSNLVALSIGTEMKYPININNLDKLYPVSLDFTVKTGYIRYSSLTNNQNTLGISFNMKTTIGFNDLDIWYGLSYISCNDEEINKSINRLNLLLGAGFFF